MVLNRKHVKQMKMGESVRAGVSLTAISIKDAQSACKLLPPCAYCRNVLLINQSHMMNVLKVSPIHDALK